MCLENEPKNTVLDDLMKHSKTQKAEETEMIKFNDL
jgi:hypothetical protein